MEVVVVMNFNRSQTLQDVWNVLTKVHELTHRDPQYDLFEIAIGVYDPHDEEHTPPKLCPFMNIGLGIEMAVAAEAKGAEAIWWITFNKIVYFLAGTEEEIATYFKQIFKV